MTRGARPLSALRCTLGASSVHGAPAGLVLTPRGALALVRDGEAVRQAILMLVSTRPGERVMRPAYGCHLFRLAFAPNDDTTAGLAIHHVRQALERWEPRIRIVALDAGRHPEVPSRLDVHLTYRLELDPAGVDRLDLPFDLATGRLIA